MLTGRGYTSPTSGFNHWSTWYLRYMTGNRNILGLLGPVALVKRDPFVDRYRDHGGEYTEVTGGRWRRIPMIGLEIERPLFVYQQDESGKFEPFDYVAFADDKGIRYVSLGGSYNDSDLIQLGKLCHEERSPRFFMWPK